MTDPRSTIPFDRLPEGLLRAVEHPPEHPAPPRPAVTVALLRDGRGEGPEVLLLRRVRGAGYVPGAWVFPGGGLDPLDADPRLAALLEGITPGEAAARLAMDADPPAVAYWVGAVREAFEETGIFVGHDRLGRPVASAAADPLVHAVLRDMLADDSRFAGMIDRMGWRMDARAMEYVAHWITAVVHPHRYDTRFFVAAVPAGTEPLTTPGEVDSAVWLTPAEALELNVRDTLPMVFPTIRTLEALLPFRSPAEVLEAFRDRPVPTIVPRLVPTSRGVGMEIEERPGLPI